MECYASLKRKWVLCYGMDELWARYAKWSKSDTEAYVARSQLFEVPEVSQIQRWGRGITNMVAQDIAKYSASPETS